MQRRIRTTLTTTLAVATMLAAGLTATAPSSADDGAGDAGASDRAGVGPTARASLRVKPARSFVGGQRLIWSGNVGARGVRTIKLQTNDERAGDTWVDVEGFRGRTKRTGAFRFAFPAPANFDITYRVSGKGGKNTPIVRFNYPKLTSQEVNLTLAGEVGDESQQGRVDLNQPYTLVADTTQALFRRPDTIGIKPIPGRTITLQRRVGGGSWDTVDTGQADSDGFARFDRPAETQRGEIVYRVRQENWFKGGDRIGWLPSFPLFVSFGGGAPRRAPSDASVEPTSGAGADELFTERAPTASNTASIRYGWAPALFDFAWTYGESLTSKPGRGSVRKGRWIDTSFGSGRVSHFNDGLGILSKRLNDAGPGDFGTTRATLQGNARAYGRWEVRLRAKTAAGREAGNDFNVVLELVPENNPTDQCRTITVTNYQPGGQRFQFGANNARNAWSDTSALGRSENVAIAFAVEVTRDHITWFREGKPVGTIDNDNAISGAALTLRMSLVGDAGGAEMKGTDLISDWQRGFDLGRGRQVEAGGAVPTTQAPGGC